ncbi:peptidoglycan endopeptidase [Sphingomonas oligophenolica]|uniref:peptidoglycan endopeptidase n=1 Tax=Sphingomonas oligophenolica TaxID=301154 RepID=UPI003CC818BB
MGEAAARALIGARFRLHGRAVAGGLDCVGVVAAALRADGFEGAVPSGYALRGGRSERVAALLDAALTRVPVARAGDVLLFAVGAGQLHLAIKTTGGIVHADAALRRVVERPGAPPWPVIGVWRFDR